MPLRESFLDNTFAHCFPHEIVPNHIFSACFIDGFVLTMEILVSASSSPSSSIGEGNKSKTKCTLCEFLRTHRTQKWHVKKQKTTRKLSWQWHNDRAYDSSMINAATWDVDESCSLRQQTNYVHPKWREMKSTLVTWRRQPIVTFSFSRLLPVNTGCRMNIILHWLLRLEC